MELASSTRNPFHAGILTGEQIRSHIKQGSIKIDPYADDQIAQASYDVRLDRHLLVYTGTCQVGNQPDGSDWRPLPVADQRVLDLSQDDAATAVTMPDAGFVLWPGIFYLGCTYERVEAQYFAITLDGKSSIARKSLKVHFTAGYIEPGFSGQVTFELEVSAPLRVQPGRCIGQLRFSTVCGHIESYQRRGHYTWSQATGPVRSLSHLQTVKPLTVEPDAPLREAKALLDLARSGLGLRGVYTMDECAFVFSLVCADPVDLQRSDVLARLRTLAGLVREHVPRVSRDAP